MKSSVRTRTRNSWYYTLNGKIHSTKACGETDLKAFKATPSQVARAKTSFGTDAWTINVCPCARREMGKTQ